MDPNQYHFSYVSGMTARQGAAPAPVPTATRDVVHLRAPDGTMRPIQNAAGRFLPASARIPHWSIVHQAEQRKAADESKKKAEAAKKKMDDDAARIAVSIIPHRDWLTVAIANVAIPNCAGFGLLGYGSAYWQATACYSKGNRRAHSWIRVRVPSWERSLSIPLVCK